MSHLMLFRFQIEFVEFLGFHFNRHAFYDFYAEAFEAVDFSGLFVSRRSSLAPKSCRI